MTASGDSVERHHRPDGSGGVPCDDRPLRDAEDLIAKVEQRLPAITANGAAVSGCAACPKST